jgi:hypothetical protein
MLRPIIYTFTYPGALTGDQDPYFTVPMDVQLVHVSAQCITQDATIFLEDDGTAITDSTTVTAGTTPVEITQSEMVGDQYPHIAKDSVIHIDIDNGSNCVDLVIVCTFTEG